MRGCVVGVEGVADESDLLLGDEDRISDVEELDQGWGGSWISTRPQTGKIDG